MEVERSKALRIIGFEEHCGTQEMLDESSKILENKYPVAGVF